MEEFQKFQESLLTSISENRVDVASWGTIALVITIIFFYYVRKENGPMTGEDRKAVFSLFGIVLIPALIGLFIVAAVKGLQKVYSTILL